MGICYLHRNGGNPRGCINTVQGASLTINDSYHRPLHNLKIYGKTTQNGTPTPDAPVPLESVGDGGSVCVTVAGKNLWRYEDMIFNGGGDAETTLTNTGIRLTAKSGTIWNGRFFRWLPISVLDGKTIAISVKISKQGPGRPMFRFGYVSEDGSIRNSSIEITESRSATLQVDSTSKNAEGCKYCCLWFYLNASDTLNSVGDYVDYEDIQIEIGDTATAYEPYKGPKTLTASTVHDDGTPNGLPGIPVSSGGNYTDENGQQWICDEVDFASGKYVQRVDTSNLGEYTWTPWGDAFWATVEGKNTGYNMLSNVYPVSRKSVDKTISGNAQNENIYIRDSSYTTADELKTALADAVLLYELATPIEHNLSAEELAQYTALHTNYPNTTVFNDCGADMVLNYYTK